MSGGRHSATYRTWRKMKARCFNPSDKNFRFYGAKGITVCARWLNFPEFLTDMGERPEGCTLDRIDVAKGYEPGNCRWVTRSVQVVNRTDNVRIEFNGKNQTISEWSAELGIDQRRICERLKHGFPVASVLDPVSDFAKKCSHCLADGHTRRNCPQLPTQPRLCSKCRQPGHTLATHWRHAQGKGS